MVICSLSYASEDCRFPSTLTTEDKRFFQIQGSAKDFRIDERLEESRLLLRSASGER